MSGDNRKIGPAAAMLWLIGSTVAFFAAPLLAVGEWGWQPQRGWLVNIVAGVLVLAAIGRVTGQHVLSDERRRWSLSRLQLLAWTLLLLPSVWTMVALKLLANVKDPIALGLDENLWAVLGIAGGSFVGASLIIVRKRATPGLLDAAPPHADAGSSGRVRDLFRGEDTGNAALVDIGRVQMCLFTAVSVVVYFAACWHAFTAPDLDLETLAFPEVSQNLVALLGISQATYLAGKLPDRLAQPRQPAGDAGIK